MTLCFKQGLTSKSDLVRKRTLLLEGTIIANYVLLLFIEETRPYTRSCVRKNADFCANL